MHHFACMASVGFTCETSHFAVCCKFAFALKALRCERKDRGQKMYGNGIHGLLVAQPSQDKDEFDSSGFSKGNGRRINVQKKSETFDEAAHQDLHITPIEFQNYRMFICGSRNVCPVLRTCARPI